MIACIIITKVCFLSDLLILHYSSFFETSTEAVLFVVTRNTVRSLENLHSVTSVCLEHTVCILLPESERGSHAASLD